MSTGRARPIGLLAVMLVVGSSLPAAGQTIDVIPTMPPAGVSCSSGTGGPSAGPSASLTPDASQPLPVVAVVPPARSTRDDLPLWRGEWETPWDHVAIAPRTDAAVTTAPRGPFRTILWGGVGADGRLLNDGVMIDDGGATRVLPAAPICPRRDFAWMGAPWSGVMVWGGTDDAGRPLADGAFYSTAYGTWRLLPPSPLPPGPAVAATTAVVVRDAATGRGWLSRITDLEGAPRWGAAQEVPLPPGVGFEIVCCDGEDLLVFSIQADGPAHAARLDLDYPNEGEWTQLGRVPLPPGSRGGPVSGRSTERDLTAWVRSTESPWPGTELTGGYGVVMRTGRPGLPWQLTAPAPEGAVDDASLVLSPTHLISPRGQVAYDLMAERWRRLPRRGSGPRFGPLEGATAWWNDGRLWVFSGRAPHGSMESRLWTFTPDLPRNEVRLTYRPDLFGYGEGCVAFGTQGTWRLRGSLDDPLVVWTQSGSKRQDTHWPEGWVARFAPSLAVVDTRGRVRYRDGDVCRLDVGTGG